MSTFMIRKLIHNHVCFCGVYYQNLYLLVNKTSRSTGTTPGVHSNVSLTLTPTLVDPPKE